MSTKKSQKGLSLQRKKQHGENQSADQDGAIKNAWMLLESQTLNRAFFLAPTHGSVMR